MKCRTLVGMTIVLVLAACNQWAGRQDEQTLTDPNQRLELQNGLLIEHMGYRGSGYTDSLGTIYNLRCNPIILTNNNTDPIRIELEFSKAYDYHHITGEETFKVFPLPKNWARTKTEDSLLHKMYERLPGYIHKPYHEEVVEPGEKAAFAIGTIYLKPGGKWGVVPNELFTNSNPEAFPNCVWLVEKDSGASHALSLGLKLDLIDTCYIIPCGKITIYTE